VSTFQSLYDTIPVNYYYINDEHLKQVSDGANNYYLYYDALGRCVQRNLNGTTTYYTYDGERPILEYASSTGIVGRNVYGKGIDEILMRTDPGVNSGYPFYYAQDHEGSVTHLLNGCTAPSSQTGNVLEKYAYDAFGVATFMDSNGNNLNPNATVFNNRFLFTGREYAATYRGTYISTFSFYEYRARAYNPNLGRFMSEDPKLFDAGDYNLFRYCHNEPIDMTDPMGWDPVSVSAEVDRVSINASQEALTISESNSDGKGLGWERATTIGSLNGHVDYNRDMTRGAGTRYTGPQRVQPPDRPGYPEGKTETYAHNHTTDAKTNPKGQPDPKGTITSPGDREKTADVSGKPIYTIARDHQTRQPIVERYRPSDDANERARHEGGVTERRNPEGKWIPVGGGSTVNPDRLNKPEIIRSRHFPPVITR
jgi:RHS repeat-associated protein